jgi:hypothetical protein
MVKVFQNIAFFMWRHMLVMIMICICASVLLTYQNLSLFNSSILIAAFAAFDFAKTKWIKIDTIQKEHIKKFGKFIWRHLLTFGVCSLIISVPIAGRMPGIEGSIILSIFAVFLDSFKGGKRAHESYDGRDNTRRLDTFDNLNPTHCGSAAWNVNPYNSGSTAYYTSSSRYY